MSIEWLSNKSASIDSLMEAKLLKPHLSLILTIISSLQVTGVIKVKSIVRTESKMGKKTIVEWKIVTDFTGTFPEEGVSFHMESHQQLPFRAELSDE